VIFPTGKSHNNRTIIKNIDCGFANDVCVTGTRGVSRNNNEAIFDECAIVARDAPFACLLYFRSANLQRAEIKRYQITLS